MDEVLAQVAEILNMSVSGVLEYYPVLRQQYMAYYTLTSIRRMLGVFFMFSPFIVLLPIFGVFALDDLGIKDMEKSIAVIKGKSRHILVLFVLLAVIYLIARVGIGVLATDILLIKEFL